MATYMNAAGLLPPRPRSSTSSSRSSRAPSIEKTQSSIRVGVTSSSTLAAGVRARRNDYIRKKTIRIKIGTWNTASMSGTEKDLGAWFVHGLGIKGTVQNLSGLDTDDSSTFSDSDDEQIESVVEQENRFRQKKESIPIHDTPAIPAGEEIDLYVLGLQEVIDITSMTEAMKPFTDPNPGKKWKRAVRKALPRGYKKVAEQQLLGLLILVFAAPDIAPTISSVDATSVGTGLMGYLGNKGAVSVRIVIGELTRLCFVNCHLAAGNDETALIRRIWDHNQVLARTRFTTAVIDGELAPMADEKIGDEDHAFWFGDLNFRLDGIPGEDVRRLLLLHTRNEYDVMNKSARRVDSELGYIPPPSTDSLPLQPQDEFNKVERPASQSYAQPPLDPASDPASLLTTLKSLLRHDQLRAQQKMAKAFHNGWQEGEIDFLPTYKYDVGSVGMFDSGEKKRSPSWCDRILYRSKSDRLSYEAKVQELVKQQTNERQDDLTPNSEALQREMLYDYDPEIDGLAYGEDYDEDADADDLNLASSLAAVKLRPDQALVLDHYVSHPRILSSDHKPLDAVFTLTYDAVDIGLRAKVQEEVVRELDKAENEGRPAVTVVLDHVPDEPDIFADDTTEQYDTNDLVHFGSVRYDLPKSRVATIANTGQVAAEVGLVDRPVEVDSESRVTPPWLTVEVSTGDEQPVKGQERSGENQVVLQPGDIATIKITLLVSDPVSVCKFNDGQSHLDDVLVLRVTDGRDHFIPVQGTWMNSCFCRTLEELVLVPDGGVRNLAKSNTNRDSTGRSNVLGSSKLHSAPRELYSFTDALPQQLDRCLAEWEMLYADVTPPWQDNSDAVYRWPFDAKSWTLKAEDGERSYWKARIREQLDLGGPLAEVFGPEVSSLVRVEILSEILIQFLKSLRNGIVTPTSWSAIQERLLQNEKSKRQQDTVQTMDVVMDVLESTPVHSVSLTFLIFMLNRLIAEITSSEEANLKSPKRSVRSRASTLSSDTASDADPPPTPNGENRRSMIFPLRLRRTQTSESTPGYSYTPKTPVDRRKAMISAYAEIFAPLIIRVPQEHLSSRDRKALDLRRVKLLEAMLQSTP